MLLYEACDAHKIEILPRRADMEQPVIAVVDDDHASADNLHDYLDATGFTAMAFSTASTPFSKRCSMRS